ncbi:MAG: metallophosphoesterase [Robiginitomaculum sp.]
MSKRKYSFQVMGFATFVAMLCLIYGFLIEPKMLKVRHVTMSTARWQGPPLKIGFMADIHIGGMHVSAERVVRIAEKMNGENPDIILIAGDYMNGHHAALDWEADKKAELERGIKNLDYLEAPLGVYAVPGNHDAYYGNAEIAQIIGDTHILLMENQHVQINASLRNKNYDFCLIGMADFKTGRKDQTMFEDCIADQSILVFMHSPDSFSLLPKDTALALAGHTHGGQINLPFYGRRAESTKFAGIKYAYGKEKYDNIPVFVTAGIGTSILPARFRAPPEIVILTLKGVE